MSRRQKSKGNQDLRRVIAQFDVLGVEAHSILIKDSTEKPKTLARIKSIKADLKCLYD